MSRKPHRYATADEHLVEVFWTLDQGWRWRRRSRAGAIVATSPQESPYSRKDAALRAAVRENPPKPRIR